MSDLFWIGRSINRACVDVEKTLVAKGMTLDEAMDILLELYGIAGMLTGNLYVPPARAKDSK